MSLSREDTIYVIILAAQMIKAHRYCHEICPDYIKGKIYNPACGTCCNYDPVAIAVNHITKHTGTFPDEHSKKLLNATLQIIDKARDKKDLKQILTPSKIEQNRR